MDCVINIRYGGAEPDDEGPESRIGHSKSKRVWGEGGGGGVLWGKKDRDESRKS